MFFYPEQSLRDPVLYPWTVRTAPERRAGNNQTIADCTFVNSWMGIRIGPEANECHTFRRVRICALRTGFHIDMTTDIGRITDVVVSPKVWCSSGFPGSPALSTLRTYLQTQDTAAAVYTRSDWEYIRGLRGLGIWYPEQPLTEPTAYPWAVRALGPKCWLTDVNLGNAWLGVDFATRRSDGHRLSYVSGGFYKVGVYLKYTIV